MNTVFLLMAEFNTGQIPLESVCGKYLSLDKTQAIRKALLQQLPFPVFRAGTQKSPWLVKVEDLAKYLDEQHASAVEDWKKMQAAVIAASRPSAEGECTAEESPSSHAA